MTLHAAHTLVESPADGSETASPAPTRARPAARLVLDDSTMPVMLNRDFIKLLLQSPHKLFLYWSFAADPRTTLRAAFGNLAAHYTLAVRLVKVESGEEFYMDAPRTRAQWFEVYPQHIYRADVGFHAAKRPFVRLLTSNEVRTPPDRASHLSAEEHEFRVEANEFARLLKGAGYDRYARGLGNDANRPQPDGDSFAAAAHRIANERRAARETADEYPHL